MAKKLPANKATRSKRAVTKSNKKAELAKVTVYIRPEQVVAIEAIQLALRQQTGERPDKSELIQEALDLLSQKYRID